MTTFNDILGTTPESTKDEIKNRYKLLANKVHPDKDGSNELFNIVKLSYDKVINGYGYFEYSPANNSRDNTSYEDEINSLKDIIKDIEQVLEVDEDEINSLKDKIAYNDNELSMVHTAYKSALNCSSKQIEEYKQVIIQQSVENLALTNKLAAHTKTEKKEDTVNEQDRNKTDTSDIKNKSDDTSNPFPLGPIWGTEDKADMNNNNQDGDCYSFAPVCLYCLFFCFILWCASLLV